MYTIAYHTVGCRLNQVETSGTIASLYPLEIKEVPFNSIADIYIINSCTVTENSHNKSLKAVKQAAAQNPEAIIVAAGCAVSYDTESFTQIPEVNLFIGAQNKEEIFSEVMKLLSKENKKVLQQQKVSVHERKTLPSYPFVQKKDSKRTRAYLKIQDGCNLSCSFCIVTIVRGESISYKKEDILAQARTLIENGYKEIVLTGVNLGNYSLKGQIKKTPFQSTEKTDLHLLLEELLHLGGDVRYRLSSINPEDVNTPLIDFIDSEPKMCKHFHISIQSASDKILKKMKRPYQKVRLEKILQYIEKTNNLFGIGTDFLVGFPGEEEKDFQETMELLHSYPFTYAHIFPFSSRKGTRADSMQYRVSQNTIRKRVAQLRTSAERKKEEFLKHFAGKEIEVIFEQKKGEILTGTASNYIKVKSKSNFPLNTLQVCKVTSSDKSCVYVEEKK